MDHPLGHYLRAQNNYVARKLLRSRVSWKLSEELKSAREVRFPPAGYRKLSHTKEEKLSLILTTMQELENTAVRRQRYFKTSPGSVGLGEGELEES